MMEEKVVRGRNRYVIIKLFCISRYGAQPGLQRRKTLSVLTSVEYRMNTEYTEMRRMRSPMFFIVI